ncbi:hypothetical protein GQ44DRAFT_780792 [Phaeosphaeriaceae sp. PMI808]|nr:hypothetical protein GQ44DRAFT_780792 [Phaeosphaeriaceae sp. PMI808]
MRPFCATSISSQPAAAQLAASSRRLKALVSSLRSTKFPPNSSPNHKLIGLNSQQRTRNQTMTLPLNQSPSANITLTEDVHAAQAEPVLRQPWKEALGEGIQDAADNKVELVKATVVVEESYNPSLSG